MGGAQLQRRDKPGAVPDGDGQKALGAGAVDEPDADRQRDGVGRGIRERLASFDNPQPVGRGLARRGG